MAFEGLSERLQNVFKNLSGKGILKEEDIKASLKEVKMALLEADVNFKVVKEFISDLEKKCKGEEILKGLNPSQMVIKLVREEMEKILGSNEEEFSLKYNGDKPTIIMLCGLQGSGKTTSASKLAREIKSKGKNPLLVGLDIYRMAATYQLLTNGESINIPVYVNREEKNVNTIISEAIEYAKTNRNNVLILDTAGRSELDDVLMDELKSIKSNFNIDYTFLVVDSMIGQDSVNVAIAFNEALFVDGLILTKLDGDSRGGAAISIRKMTGIPIAYIGEGEKLDPLSPFYPDRIASRILGMGDVLSLIENAEKALDKEETKSIEEKLKKGKFDFNDYLMSMKQLKNMGGLSSIISMLPGMGINMKQLEGAIDDNKLKRIEAIIYSMTPTEREDPNILSQSRRLRIAKGAGVEISEVNRLVKQFKEAGKQMKAMKGMFSNKKMSRRGFGGGNFPF